jgi:hypothetical protein
MIRRPMVAAALLASAACSTAKVDDTASAGLPPLCKPGTSLGKVAVVPLTRWRADQKEPAVREAIAEAAINKAFERVPCAQSVTVSAIRPDTDGEAALAAARASGADTAVQVRIEELGPVAVISIPAVWSTWSDVSFNLKAVRLGSGETLLDIGRHRKVGGAFNVRGLAPLQGELETGLRDLILAAPES